MLDFQVASPFQLTSDATITSVRFWTLQYSVLWWKYLRQVSDFSGDMAYGIYSNVNNQPGVLLGSGLAVPTETDEAPDVSFDVFETDFNLDAPVSLSTGIYWISLQGIPLERSDTSVLFWSTTNGADLHPHILLPVYTQAPGQAWEADLSEGKMAFQLLGSTMATSEPATSVLMGAAAIAILALRLRRSSV